LKVNRTFLSHLKSSNSVFCLVATVKIYSHAIIPLGSIRKTSSNIPPLSIQLEEINLISWDTLAWFGLVYLLYIGVMNFVFVEPCDKVNQNNSPSRNNCYSLKCSLLLLFSEIDCIKNSIPTINS